MTALQNKTDELLL